MIDIAIATVADLYEDNGGIPASLQFPKLDDVKADVNKVSAGGLKPGQAVIINSSTLTQASALPGFAVPDMKKTFGLTGVVKNVDKVEYLITEKMAYFSLVSRRFSRLLAVGSFGNSVNLSFRCSTCNYNMGHIWWDMRDQPCPPCVGLQDLLAGFHCVFHWCLL